MESGTGVSGLGFRSQCFSAAKEALHGDYIIGILRVSRDDVELQLSRT